MSLRDSGGRKERGADERTRSPAPRVLPEVGVRVNGRNSAWRPSRVGQDVLLMGALFLVAS